MGYTRSCWPKVKSQSVCVCVGCICFAYELCLLKRLKDLQISAAQLWAADSACLAIFFDNLWGHSPMHYERQSPGACVWSHDRRQQRQQQLSQRHFAVIFRCFSSEQVGTGSHGQTIDFSFASAIKPQQKRAKRTKKKYILTLAGTRNNFSLSLTLSCRCRLLLLLCCHDKRMRHSPSSLSPKSKCYLNYGHDLARPGRARARPGTGTGTGARWQMSSAVASWLLALSLALALTLSLANCPTAHFSRPLATFRGSRRLSIAIESANW